MGKIKVGTMKQKTLVEGDCNLLNNNEILITKSEGFTILREKDKSGKLATYVVIPLDEFIKSKNNGKSKTTNSKSGSNQR